MSSNTTSAFLKDIRFINPDTLKPRLDAYTVQCAVDELDRYSKLLARVAVDSLVEDYEIDLYQRTYTEVACLQVEKLWELIRSRSKRMDKYGVDHINEWLDLKNDLTRLMEVPTQWLDEHTTFLYNDYISEVARKQLAVRFDLSHTEEAQDRELAGHLIKGIWTDEKCLRFRSYLNVRRREAITLRLRPPIGRLDESYIIIHPDYKDADIDTIRARAREILE